MNKKLSIVLIIMLLASAAHGFEVKSIDAGMAFAWRFNAKLDSSPGGKQPSIVLLSPGVAVNIDFDEAPDGVYFRPGAWLTWVPEEIYKGVARSSSQERAGHMKIFGFISELHFGYVFKIKKFDIGFQGGPSVHIRIPAGRAKNSTAKSSEFWRAYYGKAQFIHLGINSWMAVPLEDMDFVFGINCMLPISNLWSGAQLAHGMQIALTGALRFQLKGI
ncbi:hypothetical protein JY97_08865 [Alkalispirochaeta odontotermitis]|nr:hypothetical protein JY97_08865 [Alkalispirochaeta odontotermitis]